MSVLQILYLYHAILIPCWSLCFIHGTFYFLLGKKIERGSFKRICYFFSWVTAGIWGIIALCAFVFYLYASTMVLGEFQKGWNLP